VQVDGIDMNSAAFGVPTGDAYARIGANGAGLTEVVLAAAGLDAVSTAVPSGAIGAWNFRERLVMLFRHVFGKATMTNSQMKHFAANGTTVLSTQNVGDDAVTQTQGEAT
jgi:hypothetical protein